MTKLNLCVNGNRITVLVPENLAGRTGRDSDRAVWLIAPEGSDASVWLEKTNVEQHAQEAKGIIVCLPWVKDDSFYTRDAWITVHDSLPRLSEKAVDNRILGYADSAMRVLEFLFTYSDRFSTGVSVCPKAGDGLDALAAAACEHMKTAVKEPHIAIADMPGGEAETIGAAINAHGVGAHVHANRPAGGWQLVDTELANCLAHL